MRRRQPGARSTRLGVQSFESRECRLCRIDASNHPGGVGMDRVVVREESRGTLERYTVEDDGVPSCG
jgi:hypothetical protein